MFEARFKEPFITEITVGNHKIITDLPEGMGGRNTGPTPVELMLSALLSCTATSAFFFLAKHNIPAEGIRVSLAPVFENDMVSRADIIITLPASFPEDKKAGLLAFARHCKVGAHLKFPHEVKISNC